MRVTRFAWSEQQFCALLSFGASLLGVRGGAFSRLACHAFGHRLYADPIGHPFSTRMKICERCHKLTTAQQSSPTPPTEQPSLISPTETDT